MKAPSRRSSASPRIVRATRNDRRRGQHRQDTARDRRAPRALRALAAQPQAHQRGRRLYHGRAVGRCEQRRDGCEQRAGKRTGLRQRVTRRRDQWRQRLPARRALFARGPDVRSCDQRPIDPATSPRRRQPAACRTIRATKPAGGTLQRRQSTGPAADGTALRRDAREQTDSHARRHLGIRFRLGCDSPGRGAPDATFRRGLSAAHEPDRTLLAHHRTHA